MLAHVKNWVQDKHSILCIDICILTFKAAKFNKDIPNVYLYTLNSVFFYFVWILYDISANYMIEALRRFLCIFKDRIDH